MSSLKKRRVLVVGAANTDLTAYTINLPKVGETVLGNDFRTSGGGKGANQAVAAASLSFVGLQVHIACKIGRDSFGDNLLRTFDNVGVVYDSENVRVEDESVSTGVAPILVDSDGENMIVVVPGANAKLTPHDIRKKIDGMELPPDVVLVQLEVPLDAALEALQYSKQKNPSCITILNPAPAPDVLPDSFFSCSDILIPNQIELSSLCKCDVSNLKDSANVLIQKGVEAVIVTLGAEGARIFTKNGDEDNVNVTSPLSLQEPVKDTVGAGDAFCGALASYLALGITLKESAFKACGVADMSVRRLGAQSSYPTGSELPQCLRIPLPHDELFVTGRATKPVITFVTGNKKKLEEVVKILGTGGELPFSITNKKVDLPELQGDPLGIAVEKCRLAANEVGGAVITEDTSLCFNALNGMPGPYIKWFLEKCGHDGLNMMLSGTDDKTGYAQTVVAFSPGPGEPVKVFDGRTDGIIVPARGPLDFGWDPIFQPNESGGLTYAEMVKDEKNKISHRGRSFEKFRRHLMGSEVEALQKLIQNKRKKVE